MTLAAVLVAALAIGATAAIAWQRGSVKRAPRITLTAPLEAAVGAEAIASGAARNVPPAGTVVLQRRRAGRWSGLAGAAMRRHRFRIAFAIPAARGGLRLRVVLRQGGRAPLASAPRTLRVIAPAARATPPAPAPPAPSLPPAGAAAVPPPDTEEPPGAPTEEPDPPEPQPAYWGAWIGDQLTGAEPPWDMSAVAALEQKAGKGLSILEFGAPFAECDGSSCTGLSFPTTPFEDIRAHGAIPLLSWSSQSIPSSLSQPDFQLADVTAGDYDAYIRGWAEAAKAWGHPFFLRFDWEMNGNWFPWAEGVNGNQAGDYVAAWRHVHDIFSAVGADDVSWVWCPYVDPHETLTALAGLYPGDAYVDWTCLDGYNWGPSATPPRTWRSFRYLFEASYEEITGTIAPGKPMLVGETASSESGGSKAGWIHNMFEALASEFPQIRGLLWFERYDDGMDWPLETTTESQSAFANGIAAPRYLANTLGSLESSPIPAP